MNKDVNDLLLTLSDAVDRSKWTVMIRLEEIGATAAVVKVLPYVSGAGCPRFTCTEGH